MLDRGESAVGSRRDDRTVLALCLFVAGALSAIACILGVWFWQTEVSYASANGGNALALALQKVGIAIACLGAAGVVLAITSWLLAAKR